MSNTNDIRMEIAETVTRFLNEHMVLRPKSVDVDMHDNDILVTLRQVATEAERCCAGNPASRELLERLSSATFDVVKRALEVEVALVVEREIQWSRLNLDPLEGDAILVFAMEPSGIPEAVGAVAHSSCGICADSE